MSHFAAPAFAATHGPKDAKVVLVGEAWGEQDTIGRRPFLGASGAELARILGQSGMASPPPSKPWLSRSDLATYWQSTDFLFTNVLAFRPPGGKIELLYQGRKDLPGDYTKPPISQGKYLMPEYLPELARLNAELGAYPRNLIVALGSTACWAILGKAGINALRGVTHQSPYGKCLPTYNPSGVMRQWNLRPIMVADCIKASREAKYPEIRRPSRMLLINPTLEELANWATKVIASQIPLSVDIETANKQITCIGFGANSEEALIIPFANPADASGNYWPNAASEGFAWEYVRALLESPAQKIFQNGLYDLQYLCRMGIRPANCTADTMLLHHALYPELQKGLGFLASIYADETAWKLMRTHVHDLKKDE